MAFLDRPAVSRRRIRALVSSVRTHLGWTPAEMASALGWSSFLLAEFETGTAIPTEAQLAAVISLDGAVRRELDPTPADLVANAMRRSLADRYRAALSDAFGLFAEHEEAARTIRNFETKLVPGLLQTEEYARAIIRNYEPELGDAAIEQRVAARMERADRVRQEPAVAAVFVIDEHAIHRRVGIGSRADAVMDRQVEHLKELSALPNLAIGVLPFRAGAYPAMRGPFVVLEFEDGLDPAV